MPKETSKEYQAGFKDCLAVVDLTLEIAFCNATQGLSQDVITALRDVIKATPIPRYTR